MEEEKKDEVTIHIQQWMRKSTFGRTFVGVQATNVSLAVWRRV
jgi:hypothetical protein